MTAIASTWLLDLSSLPETEREIVRLVYEGASKGLQRYGPLDLHRDRRDMATEALEEARDGLFYAAAALLQARIKAADSKRGIPLLAYLCHPYRDDPVGNSTRARAVLRQLTHDHGTGGYRIFIAPWLEWGHLSEVDAMWLCKRAVSACDELWPVGDRITSGMREEITIAQLCGVTVMNSGTSTGGK
jgi:hypothetical protein